MFAFSIYRFPPSKLSRNLAKSRPITSSARNHECVVHRSIVHVDIQSPDRLSDHDIVSGTLKRVIPPIKKPRRKVYRYQKGDYESMRSDALKFAKERYFNGYSDTRSVQENFNLITSFIQDSADKHIPSKTSRSASSVPWITPAITVIYLPWSCVFYAKNSEMTHQKIVSAYY